MKFQNAQHEERFYALVARMKRKDPYHLSAAYLMALANLPPNAVFDFEFGCIKREGLYGAWQTSSTVKATRLMFNLWNGCASDNPDDNASAPYYSVEEIFSNAEFAPYFYEAVKIRFERI